MHDPALRGKTPTGPDRPGGRTSRPRRWAGRIIEGRPDPVLQEGDDRVGEGVVAVPGDHVGRTVDRHHGGVGDPGQQLVDAFLGDDVAEEALDQHGGHADVAGGHVEQPAKRSGTTSVRSWPITRGSQCQYQRPSRWRRTFMRPAGLTGRFRCGV